MIIIIKPQFCFKSWFDENWLLLKTSQLTRILVQTLLWWERNLKFGQNTDFKVQFMSAGVVLCCLAHLAEISPSPSDHPDKMIVWEISPWAGSLAQPPPPPRDPWESCNWADTTSQRKKHGHYNGNGDLIPLQNEMLKPQMKRSTSIHQSLNFAFMLSLLVELSLESPKKHFRSLTLKMLTDPIINGPFREGFKIR